MAINLFHLSKDPNLKTMIPRVPNNRLVRSGKEDGKTPRVCFSKSIHSALASAPPARTGSVLYVYSPTSIDKSALYKPSLSQVPDSGFTHEVWYLKPVTVKKVGIIVVGDIIRSKYWYGKERESHYDLTWHNYKEIDTPKNKSEIRAYLKSQPDYQRRKRSKRKELLRGMLGGGFATLGGVAVYMLVGNILKRIKDI